MISQLKPKNCGECRFLDKSSVLIHSGYDGVCVLDRESLDKNRGYGSCGAGIKTDELLKRAGWAKD